MGRKEGSKISWDVMLCRDCGAENRLDRVTNKIVWFTPVVEVKKRS
jgi:hypothetical protein